VIATSCSLSSRAQPPSIDDAATPPANKTKAKAKNERRGEGK